MTRAILAFVVLFVLAQHGDAQSPRKDRYGDDLPPLAQARLGTVRFRASGPVGFLADNRTLLSAASEAKVVQVWDVTSGKLLREIPTGGISARRFVVAPDGKSYAVCGFLNYQPSEPI